MKKRIILTTVLVSLFFISNAQAQSLNCKTYKIFYRGEYNWYDENECEIKIDTTFTGDWQIGTTSKKSLLNEKIINKNVLVLS